MKHPDPPLLGKEGWTGNLGSPEPASPCPPGCVQRCRGVCRNILVPHVALPFPFPAPSLEPGGWNGLIWFQFQEEQRERGHVAPIRERLCRSHRENPTLGNGDGLGSPGLSSFPGEP